MKDRILSPFRSWPLLKPKQALISLILISTCPQGGGELMEWVVKTVQEVVDTPLTSTRSMQKPLRLGSRFIKTKKESCDQFDHGPA